MSDGAAKKSAAAKRVAAAKPAAQTPDEELLEQQAEEELEARAEAADAGELERVAELPDAGDGEHNGSIADAVLEATRAAKLQMLARLYELRYGRAFDGPDDALLMGEDDLLAPAPAPAAPELPDDLELDLPPAVAAILAGQQAQQQAQQQALTAALEMLAEKVAGQTGVERTVPLNGSVDDLVRGLEGTSTAGETLPDDQLEKPVVFISKGAAYRVVRKPRHRFQSPNGEQFFTTGLAADFAPHARFETDSQEWVDYLRGRPGFGFDFWELGNEPHTAPDPGVVLAQIMGAMLELDDSELAKIETEERASHKRKVVLDAVGVARNKVQGFVAKGGE